MKFELVGLLRFLPWKCIDDAIIIRRVKNVGMSKVENSVHNSTALMIRQSICIATKLNQTDKKYLDILHGLRGKICHKFSRHEIAEKVINVHDTVFYAFI